MCGIAGIVVREGAANTAAVQAMCDRMAHRGPDGEGFWQSPDRRVAFGHRRLAVIDLSREADQPMADNADRLRITFNGEIYNYLELRAALEELGHRFRTQSDTEVILEAYRAWGDACVERFNGMFAFAIWDSVHGRVFCARDRFGEKPFLYALKEGVFAFASEYKALFSLSDISADIDETKFAAFFVDATAALDHGEETLFPAIRQIPPAHTLVLDIETQSVSVVPYWKPPQATGDSAMGFEDAALVFKGLLESAVELRMRSDVAVGSCLSGGLDSGSIARIAIALTGTDQPYHAFTGRFPGTDADEGVYAAAVVEGTKIIADECMPTAQGLVDELPSFVWHNELPVGSASQYAQWCVFRLARETGVTVLLDGQGADEVLGGYEQYFAPYLQGLKRTGHDVRSEEAAIRARYPQALSMADQSWKRRMPLGFKRVLGRLSGRGSDIRLGMRSGVAADDVDVREGMSNLHDALTRDATDGFLTTLLRYGDRNSMAHSREVRLPFCDHRIMEFAATLPAEYLMGHAETKRLLRAAMQGVLPETIRTRWLKQGFVPPVNLWLQGALGEVAEAIFNDADFAQDSLWDASWWRAALTRFRAGEVAMAPVIWKPVMATLWHRHFHGQLATMPKYAAHA